MSRLSHRGATSPDPAPTAGDVRRLLAMAWLAPATLLTAAAAAHTVMTKIGDEADIEMWQQDLPVLAAVSAFFATLWLVRPPPFGRPAWSLPRPEAMLAVMAVLVVAVTWMGHALVFSGFAFTRDEDLALFQAALIAKGRLIGQAPADWRPFAAALQNMFMLQISGGQGYWLSGYLPVNSALQAIGIKLGLAGIVSPALAAAGLAATYGVGRRLWPDRPYAALIAAALLATSAQFLVVAMTPFAMTAHLALNMIWLWLFLRGGRAGHAGALLTGFLATGLHQLIFHPLFAAPFVLNLWLERRRGLAIAYALGYAAIAVFWVAYWSLVLASVSAHGAAAAGGSRFARQVIDLVSAFNVSGLGLMAMNLVRFMTWQNVLTMPLVVLGAVSAWRAGGVYRALLLGPVLTVAAMLILLPYQGVGWGYRYLHGFLGSSALLAIQAWIAWFDRLDQAARRQAAALWLTLTAVSLALVPFRAWQVHGVVYPYVKATAAIGTSRAEVVVIARTYVRSAAALVRNDPDLARRPLTMPLSRLADSDLRTLCAAHTVELFQASDAARYGIQTIYERPDAQRVREAGELERLRSLGCRDPRFRASGNGSAGDRSSLSSSG
jgi:hypothetical protein